MSKTFLFQAIPFNQTIQFSISMPLVLFYPLTGPYQVLPHRARVDLGNGNEGVLHIPQSPSITGTSPSDCLMSYPGHLLGGGLTPLQRCCQCILQLQPTEKSVYGGGVCKYIEIYIYIYIYISAICIIYIYIYIYICIYISRHKVHMRQGQFFKWSLISLNSDFSFK